MARPLYTTTPSGQARSSASKTRIWWILPNGASIGRRLVLEMVDAPIPMRLASLLTPYRTIAWNTFRATASESEGNFIISQVYQLAAHFARVMWKLSPSLVSTCEVWAVSVSVATAPSGAVSPDPTYRYGFASRSRRGSRGRGAAQALSLRSIRVPGFAWP